MAVTSDETITFSSTVTSDFAEIATFSTFSSTTIVPTTWSGIDYELHEVQLFGKNISRC